MYMCHCKIQFYDKVLKIGHNSQRSRSISIIFDILMCVIILFIHHFSKNCEKNYTLIFFIDNAKRIPHFKFAPLDYGYSGVYLQKCKVSGNRTLVVASSFCL